MIETHDKLAIISAVQGFLKYVDEETIVSSARYLAQWDKINMSQNITKARDAIEAMAGYLLLNGNLVLYKPGRGTSYVYFRNYPPGSASFRVGGLEFIGDDLWLKGTYTKGRATDEFSNLVNVGFNSLKNYRSKEEVMVYVGDKMVPVTYAKPGPHKLALGDSGKFEIMSTGVLTNSRTSRHFRSGWKVVNGVMGHTCGNRKLYYSPVVNGAAECTKCGARLSKARFKFLVLEEGMGT